MKRFLLTTIVVAGCGGKSPKPEPPKPVASNDCSASDQVAVEHGVELAKDENSPLYTSLSHDDIECAKKAVHSTAPLADGAPQCLKDGRDQTAWMTALLASKAELPAQDARDALTNEVEAVPLSQRPAYLVEQITRSYSCGPDELSFDAALWENLAETESSIDACTCTIDAPRVKLLAWYFVAGGGDWAAVVAARHGER